MRGFGWGFTGAGLFLGGLSATAISDPASPIGWEKWRDDPWTDGLIAGGVLTVLGVVLLILNATTSPAINERVTRLLWTGVGGLAGFALFAPVVAVGMCVDGVRGAFCRAQEWSSVLGLTFDGEPSIVPGIIAGFMAAFVAWLLVGRARRRRTNPGDRSSRQPERSPEP